ncbi:MAG: diguanylate cyclase [Solirubrobacterales bacterium]|nr:diguanylate cyclase [Solirubrobacterales bacterium]
MAATQVPRRCKRRERWTIRHTLMANRKTKKAGSGSRDDAGAPPAYWSSLSSDDVVGVLDRLSDGIVVLGPGWRFRYLNEPAAAMLGRTSEQLLGTHIWTEFPEGAGAPFQPAYEQAVRERRPVGLVAHYAPLDRWFETRIFPQDDNLVIVFRDVTDQQRVEDELRESGDRMSEAERIVRFGAFKWEVGSGRVRWSDEMHRIHGLVPGQTPGTAEGFMNLVHPDDRARVWANIVRAMETREPFLFEERILRGDGEERVLLCEGRPITGPDGAVEAVMGVCHDVTERTTVERALGASERRMRAIIDNTPSIIFVKDLDGRYVMTNAESERVFGVGPDELVGQRCVDIFPPAIAEAQRTHAQRAAAEGERVYDEAILVRNEEPRTYMTVTFPLPDDEGRPVEICMIATDVTERKERDSARREREGWSEQIGSSLRDGRMLAFAQPVIDLRTGAHVSSELLARLRTGDAHSEVLAPAAFLPAAERYGLIQDIDTWMVRRALALPAGVVSEVNLSAVTMGDPAARRAIIDLLAAAPEAARRIIFEITETAAAEQLEAARAFAQEATGLGCRFALDDFGTGFGAFTYLQVLPLDFLKIDLSFVHALGEAPDDHRVVQSIISIAAQFGLRTIAEGIEDQATLELLGALGADYAQGFHLGRPAPLTPGPRIMPAP